MAESENSKFNIAFQEIFSHFEKNVISPSYMYNNEIVTPQKYVELLNYFSETHNYIEIGNLNIGQYSPELNKFIPIFDVKIYSAFLKREVSISEYFNLLKIDNDTIKNFFINYSRIEYTNPVTEELENKKHRNLDDDDTYQAKRQCF
jgi:hypothetical protein